MKDQGINTHELKKEWLGNKSEIKKYDLYVNKGTGEIIIYRKGGLGDGIRTGGYLK